MKTLEITVFVNGRMAVETKGFSGRDCVAASRAFEQALGLRLDEEMTRESYERSEEVQNQKSVAEE